MWCTVWRVPAGAGNRSTACPVTRHPTRLDAFALLQSVYALETSLHTAIAETIHIRRALEDWPERGAHPLHLERIITASQHIARANTQLKQFPLGKP